MLGSKVGSLTVPALSNYAFGAELGPVVRTAVSSRDDDEGQKFVVALEAVVAKSPAVPAPGGANTLSLTLTPGDNVGQLAVFFTWSDGSVTNDTENCNNELNDTGIIDLSPTGEVSAVGAGTDFATCSFNAFVDTVFFEVS